MDAASLISIAGALGLGSVVGQYAGTTGQRRETRAAVLGAVADVETARWAGPGKREPFHPALRELDTAALLARIPRDAVTHYKLLAQAGYWVSAESWEESPDPEWGGEIPATFANLIREAAGELSHLVWSPWLARRGLKRRIKARERRAGAVNDSRVKSALERSRNYPA